MNKRTVRAVAGIGAVALAMVGITANVSFADEKAPPAAAPARAADAPAADAAAAQADGFVGGRLVIPPALVPPAGNRLDSVFKARGVQIYGCATGTWTLTEPAASLTGITLDPVRRVTAIHFRGPSWLSDMDGTLIEGAVPPAAPPPVSAPSATPNSIPQLLITAARTRGTGTFGGVTFVQRLATVGGIAPGKPCTAADTAAVRYTAVYRFFKAA